MPPFDVDPSSGQFQQQADQGPMRRPGHAQGNDDYRDKPGTQQQGDNAQQRMRDEAWQRPREFARVDAQRPQGPAENPYQHLQRAHDAMRTKGIEHAEPHYKSAIQSADRIDQNALKQERMNNARQLQALEQELASQGGRASRDLRSRKEALTSRDRELYELYMSPATSRANMALAYIRTGYPAYVQQGEQLLGQAMQLRPEMKSDGHFQRHLQQAYSAGQGRRDVYQWGDPNGQPGGDRNNPSGQQPRSGDGGQGGNRPPVGPGGNRVPADGGGGRDVPRDPGQQPGPGSPRPGETNQGGDGRKPSRYDPWVVPPGTTSDQPAPPPGNGNTQGGAPNDGSKPTDGTKPAKPGDQPIEKPGEIPEPQKPGAVPQGENYEPGAAQTIGRGLAILAGLGLTLLTAKRLYGLAKKGVEWYRARNEKAGEGTIETFENKDGTKLKFEVDGKGEVTRTTVAMKDGSEISIDKEGRLTRVKEADGRVTEITHGQDGKVRHEIRDANGNMLKEKSFQDGQLRMRDTYGPDTKLRMSESFDASGNLTVEKNFDTMGKLVDEHTYDADGKITKSRDGDGRDITLKPEKKAELEQAAAERKAADKAAAEKSTAQLAAAEKAIADSAAEKAAADKAAADKAAADKAAADKAAADKAAADKAAADKAAADKAAADKAAADKAAVDKAAADKAAADKATADKAAADKAAAERAAATKTQVSPGQQEKVASDRPAVPQPAAEGETSDFHESQEKTRGRDTAIKVEAKEAAGGLAILADKTIEPELRKTLEKYQGDQAFQELMEKKINEAKDEKEKGELKKQLEEYRKLPEAERARVREVAAEEAVATSKAGGRGRTVGRALAIGGTLIAIGMLADCLISESRSYSQPSAPAVKPTVGK